MDKLDMLINKHVDDVIAIRRDLHEYPELGYEEHRTSEIVAKELEKLGFKVQRNMGKLGVIGLLRGKEEGKTILLRADMDALPLEENNDLPFKSKNPGIMHACGHDVHVSVLLGVAKVLAEYKDQLKGNVKFAFQPAEESNPTGGARYMIEAGALENPKVDAALGLHVWDLPLGKVALRPGAIMAQSDRIYLTVKGKASHGAQPENGADAIVAAAHIITALQTIVSRNVGPLDSAVVTIGTIIGGARYNNTPDLVKLEGTVRIFDPKISDLIPKRIKEVAENVAIALGCECEVNYVKGWSVTVNDEELNSEVTESFANAFGRENIIIPNNPATTGEDFSEFSKKVPSVYFWLGIGSEINEGRRTLHNPNLIVDERAIPIGMKAFVVATLDYLNK